MNRSNIRLIVLIIVAAFLLNNTVSSGSVLQEKTPGFQFEISFSADAHSTPITGRVYVIISSNKRREPRFQAGPTGVPIWGKNIYDLKPGDKVVIDSDIFGYPLDSIKDIPAGEYYVQSFINIYTEFKRSDGHVLWMHNDQWEGQRWNRSPGNIYSEVQKVSIDPRSSGSIFLEAKNVIPPIEVPQDNEWVKRIKFKSKKLSEFWGQPIYLGATILLPAGYEKEADRLYPVNYIQGHFSLRTPFGFVPREPDENNPRAGRGYEFYKFWTSEDCPRMMAVTFQHPCPFYDDSYAVNSANVGPYGDAIIEELIPYIEERFRIIRKPYARILSGGSTGGWEALALQIFYPDFFGGAFSSCPDPVDFRYYQIVNIYRDPNAYYQDYGWVKVERPNCRSTDGNIRFTMENENHFELVIGDKSRSGGQWDIWEAVYSPVGEDGYPKRIWDKKTGEIDHSIAKYWKENYDLRNYLEKNWEWLGPKLAGKLFVYTGTMDSFYLNEAVIMLEDFLEKTKDPHYAGSVEYGEKEPHCWGPRGAELVKLIAEHVERYKDK